MRALHLRSRHLTALTLAVAASAGLASPAHAVPRTKEVSTNVSNAGLTDIAAAADGSLWISSKDKGSLFAVQSDGQVLQRPLTGLGRTATPEHLAGGPDGNLWSTDGTAKAILRSTPAGVSTEFKAGLAPGAAPMDIALGGDGNLWFASAGDDDLGQITPAGVITRFPAAHAPVLLATDAQGAVWFTTRDGYLGRADASGTSSYLPVSGTPTGLTAGPDGNAWLTTATSVVRVTPSGSVASFTSGIEADSVINDIVAGPDGNLWYSDQGNSVLGRVTPAGAVSTFATENSRAAGNVGSPPKALAVGSDGQLTYFGRSSDDLLGDVVGVTSPATVPTGTLLTAFDFTTSNATMTASINPEGGETSVHFDYGTTTGYGRSTPSISVGSGITAQAVAASVTDLEPKRTYYYRVVAGNYRGEWMSPPLQFTTPNIVLPIAPIFPSPPTSPTPGTDLLPPSSSTTASGLQLGVKAVKVGSKGIIKLKVSCSPAGACSGTLAVTARVKGKRSKAVVIATKEVSLAAGATAKVGLRVSAAGQKAIRKAGRKGLATLAVATTGTAKTRARLTLKR